LLLPLRTAGAPSAGLVPGCGAGTALGPAGSILVSVSLLRSSAEMPE
jgi:hypothetical protein